MGKPLTKESLITDPQVKKGKFELALNKETFNQLVRYIILTNEGKGRNKFVNSLIEKELEGKVLENNFIKLFLSKDYYYFNKSDLINNGVAEATKNLIDYDLKETIIINMIPNNLDSWNDKYKTFCYGDDKTTHAGVYILPNVDGENDNYLFFKYDSDKELIIVRLVDDINIYFDETNQHIKERLINESEEIKTKYNKSKLTIGEIAENGVLFKYETLKTIHEKNFGSHKEFVNYYFVEGSLFKNFNK